MIVHKNVLNSFLVNNCRLGRVDINPPSLIFNNNNMALQVWLPLINNIENQGVSNIPIINNEVTFIDGGKIGKCASFNNNYFSLQNLSNFNTISISFWMKPANTNQTGCLLNYRTGIGLDLAIFLIQGKVRFDAGGQTIFNYTYTTDWQHITVTYDGNIKSLYVNGILNQSVTINKAISCTATKGTVGASSVNTTSGSDNNYIGLLNDYRIYNHYLSPKEVKEISKGLVLHYPLNDAYVEGTTNLVTSITNGGQTTVNGYEVTTSGVSKDTYFTLNLSEKIVAGNTYTISCRNNFDTGLYWDFPIGSQANQTLTWRITSGYSSYTFVANSSNSYWNKNTCFMDDLSGTARNAGKSFKMWDWQIEKKDHATPFVIGTRNETTVYDCSGYQNNGTISGSLSCSSDSPRYNKSCNFGSGIIGTMSGFASAQSYTFWANVIDKTAQIVFVDGASKLGFGMISTYFICSSAGKTSAKYSTANLTIGWHHFAVVNDLLYIDGVLQEKPSGVDMWAYSGSMLEIGNRSNGNSYPWKGQISDFRVYATALSEEDIKELYNTSCIINS